MENLPVVLEWLLNLIDTAAAVEPVSAKAATGLKIAAVAMMTAILVEKDILLIFLIFG
jgi:hypothetical protein